MKCFPHARGDGPRSNEDFREQIKFSPRPWGWSVPPLLPWICSVVFPTPVGMVRVLRPGDGRHVGFPHARGDGPFIVNIEKY